MQQPNEEEYVDFATYRERRATPAWTGTSEVVRDLHRSLTQKLPGDCAIPSSRSAEHRRTLLHPDIGTASELAQPGGFRRAHLAGKTEIESEASVYRATPLLVTLRDTGFMHSFVTRAVQVLGDGLEVRYESRPYRRGAKPYIVRTTSGELLEPPRRVQFCGFRPRSVPYWSSVSFLIGAVLFTEGSLCWMCDAIGDAAVWGITYPYFLGSIGFLIGCYLAFVEVINANLSEDLAAGALEPEGSIHRRVQSNGTDAPLPQPLPPPLPPLPPRKAQPTPPARPVIVPAAPSKPVVPRADTSPPSPKAPENWILKAPPFWLAAPPQQSTTGRAAIAPAAGESCAAFLRRLHWWRFQPHSLLWWGALAQLGGALLFEVACVAILPSVEPLTAGLEPLVIYLPSVVGSVCFVFASYVYLLEVAADPRRPWRPPVSSASPREQLGYAVACCNLFGSVLFSFASLCYFAHADHTAEPDWDGALEEWEQLASMWGLRFNYAAGSACFVAGALLSFPELLSDD